MSRAVSKRQQELLEILARQLEEAPRTRITTARLAAAAGVSEAALYRHFPSKARMFEELIAFAEASVQPRLNQVMDSDLGPPERVERLCRVVLLFAERNRGIARLLVGDVLVGEDERLQHRAGKFFANVEVQVKQVLRSASLAPGIRLKVPVETAADLLLAWLEGRLARLLRAAVPGAAPGADWDAQWRALAEALFVDSREDAAD